MQDSSRSRAQIDRSGFLAGRIDNHNLMGIGVGYVEQSIVSPNASRFMKPVQKTAALSGLRIDRLDLVVVSVSYI